MLSIKQTGAISSENQAHETSFGVVSRIYQVTDGLRSKHTKKAYRTGFNQFLKDGAKTTDQQVLLDHKPKVLEQMIIGYVEGLRER